MLLGFRANATRGLSLLVSDSQVDNSNVRNSDYLVALGLGPQKVSK